MIPIDSAAPRAASIPVSVLHDVHRAVLERKGPTLALHVGEPAVGMPAVAIEALARAARERRTGYSDAPGLPELRERLADHFTRQGGAPAEVFVTPGSCQALAAILLAIAQPGASVLLPAIHWPTYVQQAVMAGLEPRFFSDHTAPNLVAALEAAYQPSVRVAILTSPANPSGVVMDRESLVAAHAWALERHVWLVSDEAYEDFVFEGEGPCLWRLDQGVEPERRRVFSVHTFSKGFSFTGCRLGYAAAPNDRAAKLLRRVQEACIISPSAPIQWAGLAALGDPDHRLLHHRSVRATRDAALAKLDAAGLTWRRPQGGWYALLDVSDCCEDAEAFCGGLLEAKHVAVAPGSAFGATGRGMPRLVRVALCGRRADALEGVDRILAYRDQQRDGQSNRGSNGAGGARPGLAEQGR